MHAVIESVEGTKEATALEQKNVIATVVSLVIMAISIILTSSSVTVYFNYLYESLAASVNNWRICVFHETRTCRR